MIRFYRFIPAAFLFVILTSLFLFMCLPEKQSGLKITTGVLDLRGSPQMDKITALHGEWEFVYGKLLTPNNFSHSVSSLIDVPKSWDTAGYQLNGCATYRLTIITSENNRPLTLYLPEIPSAYALWVNGELLKTCGTVSENAWRSSPGFENAIISIVPENGCIELVLQISNYHYVAAGLNGTLLIGGGDSVAVWYARTRAFYCIAMGCILMAAFYHLTLFIYSRYDLSYLLFALICFICFARFIVETNGINEFLNWIPMNLIGIKFYLFMFFLHSCAIIVFSIYVFKREILKKYSRFLLPYFAITLLLTLVMPMNTPMYILMFTVLTLPFSVSVVFIAAKSQAIKDSSVMRLYFVALIIYNVVGVSSKMINDNVLFMPGLLSNMFMVMSQSLVLARRYTDAFHLVEETNHNLENIVGERTESLQSANAALFSANKAMKELVSNISHDLKTPLAVMSLNLESLLDMTVESGDSIYERYVRIAYQKNLDLQRLIKNLFEVSRIETGRSIYSPEWLPLLNLLVAVEEKYESFLEEAGIDFRVAAEENVEIYADPQKIWSVFDNIIYNAARHTEPGGCISISACRNLSAVNIVITDTGCGIAPEHLPRLFERFYKASQSRGDKEGDSGLGLYIVKSVMENFGGEAAVESEIGQGTSIILTFLAR